MGILLLLIEQGWNSPRPANALRFPAIGGLFKNPTGST